METSRKRVRNWIRDLTLDDRAECVCRSVAATTEEPPSGLYASSVTWYTHPGAVKYITCRVMSFRPWQSSVGPLWGLSRLRGGIALILSIPTMTFPASSFISSIFISSPQCVHLRRLSIPQFSHPLHFSSSPRTPNLPPFCFNFLRLPVHGGRHLRAACHKAPQLTAVPWSRNPTLTLGFHPEII